MKTITLILLVGLTLPLIAKDIDWGRLHKELSEENSRRFRERMHHDDAMKQRERIHRESSWQRERIAADNRKQLERIETRIPRYDYRYGKQFFKPETP